MLPTTGAVAPILTRARITWVITLQGWKHRIERLILQIKLFLIFVDVEVKAFVAGPIIDWVDHID